MSVSVTPIDIVQSDQRRRPETTLHPVPVSQRRPPRVIYAMVALGGISVVIALRILLSLMTTQATFEASRLNQRQSDLTVQVQILQNELSALDSPQNLAQNAARLGMVTGGSPGYLRLSDGHVSDNAQAPASVSDVDALHRNAVSNSLLTAQTSEQATESSSSATEQATTSEDALPPSAGIPTPETH